jgi:uncharacterized membrane protein SirB2
VTLLSLLGWTSSKHIRSSHFVERDLKTSVWYTVGWFKITPIVTDTLLEHGICRFYDQADSMTKQLFHLLPTAPWLQHQA